MSYLLGYINVYYGLCLSSQLLNKSAESHEWQQQNKVNAKLKKIPAKWILASPGKNNNTHSYQGSRMTKPPMRKQRHYSEHFLGLRDSTATWGPGPLSPDMSVLTVSKDNNRDKEGLYPKMAGLIPHELQLNLIQTRSASLSPKDASKGKK